MRFLRLPALLALLIAPAAFAELVTDDFNRANGAVGANWTTTSPGGLLIVSNQVSHTTTPDQQGSLYSGASFGTDQFSEVTLTAFDATPAGNNALAVGCRMSGVIGSNTYDGYVAVVRLDLQQYNILEYTNSSSASLSGGLQNLASLSVNDVFRIECEGTTISFFQNGTLVDSATDATYTTGAPDVNLYRLNSGTSGDTALSADNFRAGDCLTTPSITSVDGDDTFVADDTSIPIVGTGFCDDQGVTGSVTIYEATADEERECAINSWTDTLINADCSGLVGFGVANGLKYGTISMTVTNDAPE